MSSASTEQPATISAVQWQALLGESLPEQNLNWLNGRLRINEVPPGRTLWHSNSGATGWYIVLAGKVRLFDDQGEKLAVLKTDIGARASRLIESERWLWLPKMALVWRPLVSGLGFQQSPSQSQRWPTG
jgi:hypothetical protein